MSKRKKNTGDEIVAGLRKLAKKLRKGKRIKGTRVERYSSNYVSVPIVIQKRKDNTP